MLIRKVAFLLFAVCFAGLTCAFASAQDFPRPKEPFDASPLVNAVLNVLFPVERPLGSFNVFLTLRSFSSARFENESQINVLQDDAGHFHVVQYYTASGSESIRGQMGDLYVEDKLNPNDDPIELAKRFKVELRSVDIAEGTLMNLLNELNELSFPAIRLDPPEKQSLTKSFMVDGFHYEFSYWSAQGELHLSLNNPQSQKGNVQLLGKWIERLECAINAAPGTIAGSDLVSRNASGKPRSGLLLGFVEDSGHAGISGASVTVTEKKSNTRIADLRSDEHGEFLVADLQPGVYTIAVEANNPRIHSVQDVTVVAARQADVSVRAEGRISH
jgi:hypothetical protein